MVQKEEPVVHMKEDAAALRVWERQGEEEDGFVVVAVLSNLPLEPLGLAVLRLAPAPADVVLEGAAAEEHENRA
ncbi:hypothetical protein MCAP1_000704 [Malassezia caprae]|uniref:Uncharacterized protein n=1 Tax=Malassezia caprae TaxID=1381934 RepID=A0AAF0E408_9BASI|nr:hypothetical protein MCAP1_000704 [Malassezia caprae]